MKKNKFSIVFVGTSSGKTSLKRFHSSLLIKSKDLNLLIDCGEGTSKALLHHKISFNSIDGILFSHLHPDHSAGLPSFIVQQKQQQRTKPLKVFCHKNLTSSLKIFLRNSFVFTERAAFSLEYLEFEHDKEITVSDEFSFISRQNSHLDKYLRYLEDKNFAFACSSFLLKLGERKVFYSGDVNTNQDLYIFEKENPEIIISEVTHVNWDEIIKCYELLKPKKIYLIHYSDEHKREINAQIKTLPNFLKQKIVLSKDGMLLKL